MRTALPLILLGYSGLFAMYVTVRLTTIKVRQVCADRRFKRYLRELEIEADGLFAQATLRHMTGGSSWT